MNGLGDFTVAYLCVLDPGCNRGHSLNCQEKNERRAKALVARERARRLAQIEADIVGDAGKAGLEGGTG